MDVQFVETRNLDFTLLLKLVCIERVSGHIPFKISTVVKQVKWPLVHELAKSTVGVQAFVESFRGASRKACSQSGGESIRGASVLLSVSRRSAIRISPVQALLLSGEVLRSDFSSLRLPCYLPRLGRKCICSFIQHSFCVFNRTPTRAAGH